MPEIVRPKKCVGTVAYLLYEFLRIRNCTFDELILFADNTGCQNKNRYVFSALSRLDIRNAYRCKQGRLSFICVGHNKLSPDRWFGFIKNRLNSKIAIRLYTLRKPYYHQENDQIPERLVYQAIRILHFVILPIYKGTTLQDYLLGDIMEFILCWAELAYFVA